MPATRFSPQELKKFDDGVQQIAAKFPEIVRIRYSFGEDWDGYTAIFFRIVLFDDAATDDKLGDVTGCIGNEVFEFLLSPIVGQKRVQ
jgi:hypothetical protein